MDQKQLETARAAEQEAWKKWKKSDAQAKKDLKHLRTLFRPVIERELAKYKGCKVSGRELRAALVEFVTKAILNYNPEKQPSLTTWVHLNSKRVGRLAGADQQRLDRARNNQS